MTLSFDQHHGHGLHSSQPFQYPFSPVQCASLFFSPRYRAHLLLNIRSSTPDSVTSSLLPSPPFPTSLNSRSAPSRARSRAAPFISTPWSTLPRQGQGLTGNSAAVRPAFCTFSASHTFLTGAPLVNGVVALSTRINSIIDSGTSLIIVRLRRFSLFPAGTLTRTPQAPPASAAVFTPRSPAPHLSLAQTTTRTLAPTRPTSPLSLGVRRSPSLPSLRKVRLPF